MPLSSAELLQHLQPIADPELGFSIVDLGLVYEITSESSGTVRVLMTLTTPTCPLQPHFSRTITDTLMSVPSIAAVEVRFTFTPRWTIARVTPEIKEALALRGIGAIQW